MALNAIQSDMNLPSTSVADSPRSSQLNPRHTRTLYA